MTAKQSILLGIGIRVALIAYAEVQDRYFNLKYTDIDYSVYSDGAKYVMDGGSPYDRHTYRYTPILAYLMIGNHVFFESFGKWLFSAIDVITVLLMNQLIKMSTKTIDDKTRAFLLNLWLLNPLTIQVSTRGNADTIVVFLVYVTLYLLLTKRYTLAALAYGFVVHFKIYPIIHSLPIYFYIDHEKKQSENQILGILTYNRVKFALVSAAVFLSLLVLFHLIYPDAFLYQTYFYHLIRKDNRHNFSPYFYFIYLYFTTMTPIQSVLAFLPQFLVVAVAGTRYYKDLPFCLLIQTLGFVTFNKVCTAQYFVWWIALLPLALVNNLYARQKRGAFMVLMAIWFITEVSWNLGAYLLEIRGINSFSLIFILCMVFFIANVYLINALLVNHIPRRFIDLKKEQ